MSEYLVVIEHEGDSWGAYVPDLPGVGVSGETRDEVEQLIRRRSHCISRVCAKLGSRSQSQLRSAPR